MPVINKADNYKYVTNKLTAISIRQKRTMNDPHLQFLLLFPDGGGVDARRVLRREVVLDVLQGAHDVLVGGVEGVGH